jgi:hypothetical protein
MPQMRATLDPSGARSDSVALGSAHRRRMVIARAATISLACLAMPMMRGGNPAIGG